jgi:hypothetical protein
MKAYTERPRGDAGGDAARSVASVLERAAGSSPGQPAVLLRLCLYAPDAATGADRLVSSFLKPLSMPLALVGPDVHVAIEIGGDRHVLEPTSIIWDEAQRVCIIEVWLAADGGPAVDAIGEHDVLAV